MCPQLCLHGVLLHLLFNGIWYKVFSSHDIGWLMTNYHGVLQVLLVILHFQHIVVSQHIHTQTTNEMFQHAIPTSIIKNNVIIDNVLF